MDDQVMTLRNCPSCNSSQATLMPRYNRDHWRIVQCDQCSLIYLQNPPAYEALEEEFAWEETYAKEDARRAKKRGPLKKLAAALRNLGYRIKGDRTQHFLKLLGPGKVLDIGCADKVRLGPPYIPFGIEISKVLAARADEKMRALGGRCVQGAGAEAIWDFDAGSFDVVTMHSYLEHEVAIGKVLEGAKRVLKPEGKVYVRVPNFTSLNRRFAGPEWPGFRYPDHVNYFTPDTLRQVAEKSGFSFKLVNRGRILLDDNILSVLTKPNTAPGAQ